MIDPHFDHKTAEPRLYEAWEASGAFHPQGEGEPYAIVIPPPNVTGVLHMGHALNNTLQDILVRHHRMRGRKVLWQPGTDHAGIATQMVVERELAKTRNVTRRELGREAFLAEVWKWKEQSGGAIGGQLRRLGASCDWSRERFTLDDGLSAAVTKVFVELYRQGLIYRDKRLVNWDVQFQSAVSDLEVENREVKGQFWHIRYPLEDGETYRFPIAFNEAGEAVEWEDRDYIAIATTRPETMLGDGAVAVHTDDERYSSVVGKRVRLPLAERSIPIIADPYPDPDFGSGAVKITGAHDFNDYQVARRHGIELFILLDEQGRMRPDDYIPEAYRGLDRFEARRRIVADLEAAGLLDRVEDKTIMQPFGDRSGVVIEPMLTDQWYVDAATLARPAIEAVETGRTRFVPEQWERTYFEWMRNIEPWCVSRQLWWGHRIPAWYGPDGAIFVAYDEAEAAAQAETHYGAPQPLRRDEDVLDTWFSSALWPFSTMGWPDEQDPALKTFYPGAVLVTGFDIIFFWVARMMMQGLHFMKEVPFRDVYIHALVRDEKGQKMSKSKGNVIDPLELIDAYGADALRFTLAAMAAQGRDIKLARQRVEGYRNFSTKLWNAARFTQMNECVRDPSFDPSRVRHTLNRWIVSESVRAVQAVTEGLAGYRFNEAAAAAYRFTWNVFCDWYLELTKPLLSGDDEALKAETRATAAWAFERIITLLHPFMPFVTEELFGRLCGEGRGLLISASWPEADASLVDEAAEAEVDWAIRLITAIRSARADLNVPVAARTPLFLCGASEESRNRLGLYRTLIERLARLENVELRDEPPPGAIRIVHDEAIAALSVSGVIDLAAEASRLRKEVARCEADITAIDRKLSNAQFVAKAPPEVVEEQHERRSAAEAARAKFSDSLRQLEAVGGQG
jgi:valyl-tRNA synthetase